MIVVTLKTPTPPFIEFIRVDLTASDDGTSPVASPPYEIVYTVDGSAPTVDVNGHPLGTSKKRRSPIRQIPFDGPTTLKFFARTTDGLHTTLTQNVFLDIQSVTARNEIHTAAPDVSNYTMQVLNGDIVPSGNGIYDIVSGVGKTKQDIREVILVENVPTNSLPGTRTLPRFGSALPRILGQSLPVGFAQGQIQTTVFEALTFLAELQRTEQVPSDEQIDSILSIHVQALTPTAFRYTFQVRTVSGKTVSDAGIIGG